MRFIRPLLCVAGVAASAAVCYYYYKLQKRKMEEEEAPATPTTIKGEQAEAAHHPLEGETFADEETKTESLDTIELGEREDHNHCPLEGETFADEETKTESHDTIDLREAEDQNHRPLDTIDLRETEVKESVIPQVLKYPIVWMMGDSYAHHVEEMARSLQNKLRGHASVSWYGWSGLKWLDLIPMFYTYLEERRTVPDILVIHCGGNDIGQISSGNLVASMKEDLQNLHDSFPEMRIVLSEITQRCWWGYKDPNMIECSRNWVSSVMAEFAWALGGCYVYHPDIVSYNPQLFTEDGDYLSTVGNNILFSDIANCLKNITVNDQPTQMGSKSRFIY